MVVVATFFLTKNRACAIFAEYVENWTCNK